MGSLMQASLSGIRWTALSQLLGQVAQYGSLILLARLLVPDDFGTVATATLVVGLLALLNELGLGAALIQRQALRQGHLNACFVANLAVGFVLWGLLVAASGPIAAFFRNGEVGPIVAWLGASFPLVGLAVVPKALLEKDLRFKAVGAVDATAAIAGAGVAVALAMDGFGAWSLVAGTLTTYGVQLVLFWAVARYLPGWRCTRADFLDLFGFGANVLGTRMLSYFNANLDYLVIGRVLGPVSLGAYSLAYKLVTWPMLKISHVTLRVVFPAFARVQNDDASFRRNYMKLVTTIALVTFPLLTGLAVFAPELVPLIFGPQWHAVILPTQILCLTGALKALVCSIGTVFMSKGRPDLELKLNLVSTVLMGSAVLVGVRWGVVGVAWALAASSLVGAPLQQACANRLIGLKAGEFLAGLRVPVCSTAVLGLVLVAWRQFAVAQGLADWAIVLGAVPLGAVGYLLPMSAMGYDWRGLARQVLGRRAPSATAP